MTYLKTISPVFPVTVLRRELDRFFEEALPPRSASSSWQPPVGAFEDAEGMTLELDIPGIAPESVEVLTEDGTLTIKGARSARPLAEGERVVFADQPAGAFTRRFRLPKGADVKSVTAHYALGVLRIRVAKLAAPQPHRVPVTVQSGSAGEG